jgi:hypothetical protein
MISPIIIDPTKAADVPSGARAHIAVIVPVAKLGESLMEVPSGRRPVLIFTRAAWRQVKDMPVPADMKAQFDKFEVKSFTEALSGAGIPAYITEGGLNLEDCIEEILYHWKNASIIRVTADERNMR